MLPKYCAALFVAESSCDPSATLGIRTSNAWVGGVCGTVKPVPPCLLHAPSLACGGRSATRAQQRDLGAWQPPLAQPRARTLAASLDSARRCLARLGAPLPRSLAPHPPGAPTCRRNAEAGCCGERLVERTAVAGWLLASLMVHVFM